MDNYYDEIDREAMEYNEKMRNETDKLHEYIEMKIMYEEGLLEQ